MSDQDTAGEGEVSRDKAPARVFETEFGFDTLTDEQQEMLLRKSSEQVADELLQEGEDVVIERIAGQVASEVDIQPEDIDASKPNPGDQQEQMGNTKSESAVAKLLYLAFFERAYATFYATGFAALMISLYYSSIISALAGFAIIAITTIHYGRKS